MRYIIVSGQCRFAWEWYESVIKSYFTSTFSRLSLKKSQSWSFEPNNFMWNGNLYQVFKNSYRQFQTGCLKSCRIDMSHGWKFCSCSWFYTNLRTTADQVQTGFHVKHNLQVDPSAVDPRASQMLQPLYVCILTQSSLYHTEFIASDTANWLFNHIPESFAILSSRK